QIVDALGSELESFIIFPKLITNGVRDEVQGDIFKHLNGYEEWKRYGATSLLMVLDDLTLEQAKNRARNLIECDYDEVKAKEREQPHERNDISFILNDKGKPLTVWHNMQKLLEFLNVAVAYNELSKRIEFTNISYKDDMKNATFTMIRSIALMNDLKLTKDETYDFIELIAERNRYNPVAIYLEKCKEEATKDDYSEIDKLFETIVYDTTDKTRIRFCNRMIKKWLMNCVHLAFNTIEEERTCELVPTFRGNQGIGKSKWARSIVPKQFFKGDVILNLESKDSIAETLENWIVELGEISGTFKKSENNKLKAFITSNKDTWRSPFARASNTYPRRTCFIATVNDGEFLTDKTGSRRYFVLPVKSLNYQ
ncbi:MAG: hypothetical protein HUJ63_01735, partial [Enterococcus sp.]|nr:hypothetical protein [Enterococcus sp.]